MMRSPKDMDTMDIHSGGKINLLISNLVMVLEAPSRRKIFEQAPFMRTERLNAVSVPKERKG